MTHRPRPRNAGMALVMALMFISIAAIALAAMTARYMNQRVVVDNYDIYVDAFAGLEAAIARSRIEVEQLEDGNIGMDGWAPSYDASNSVTMPALNDAAIAPQYTATMPEVIFTAYAADWFTDGRDSNGDGAIDDDTERNMYTIYAQAGQGDMVRRAEVVCKAIDVNVWRNAIFAGNGQAGNLINGNVSIHGSVHLLGRDLAPGAAAIAALDLSGTSLIHNNYEGMPQHLRDRIPALPQAAVNGEIIDTLEAKLRVKNGLVSLSGNSEIGEPNVAGNDFKETMDGTYVSDGWTGNSVTDDGDRGDPTSVFSDNGWDELYDLGSKVPFPMLSDDWREPSDGARVQDPSTGVWYTHEDFFSQVLVADPDNTTDGIYTGDIVIDAASKSDFYFNATTGITSTTLPAATPPSTDDYIAFDAANNVLEINGQMRINGNLTISGKGNDDTIYYSGRAAFLVDGDIILKASLLTCNNGNPSNIANSFPANNIIGLMATDDMFVGSTSQLDIMGAFYAQDAITSAKQTNIIGTIVGNSFNMGTNVPDIFQVPTLADNLPLGMIGNYPLITLHQVSWRETR